MNKLDELKAKANTFQILLEKYAINDADVADFLEKIKPWFEKINNGQIVSTCDDYDLSIYFTNPDPSPLAEKYLYSGSELGHASSDFSACIHGW